MNIDDLVKLDDISEQYFNITPKMARLYAANGKLPVPAFKLNDSRKGPYWVRKVDLAKLIEDRLKDAQLVHEAAQEN